LEEAMDLSQDRLILEYLHHASLINYFKPLCCFLKGARDLNVSNNAVNIISKNVLVYGS
jgi:hypothetical protein